MGGILQSLKCVAHRAFLIALTSLRDTGGLQRQKTMHPRHEFRESPINLGRLSFMSMPGSSTKTIQLSWLSTNLLGLSSCATGEHHA
jgi:hypothetical protein